MRDYVVLKGKKDRLVAQLDNEIDFEKLVESFIVKIKQAESFIGNSKIAIEFVNRELTEEEENRLLTIIKQETEINIAFVYSDDLVFSELPILENMKDDESEDGLEQEKTKFYRGTLRSGQVLEFDGNVVILGDINSGAIVKASGNVLALGYINGTVHSGNDENMDTFIGAFSLNPLQIKIGDIIAKNPSENSLDTVRIKKSNDFEVAYIKKNTIVIEKFSKTTLNNILKN